MAPRIASIKPCVAFLIVARNDNDGQDFILALRETLYDGDKVVADEPQSLITRREIPGA